MATVRVPISQLPVVVSPTLDALVPFLNDPSGTPVTSAMELDALGGVLAGLVNNTAAGVILEGFGGVIAVSTQVDLFIPYACEILGVSLLANTPGSIVIDIWSDVFGNYPPTDADSITAAAPPTLVADDAYTDDVLTGWTTTLPANSTLRFNVDSVSSISRITLTLKLRKT
jgi:hypothetical protein